ncbi:type II toxin-antitoxin system Phd/YefM family antitoxin [Pseudonocardia sp. CA-142604]|uniref:type II toxin-antitoxin system Phd/YefM family antitoxin n=1 Tax=Pseudonocardia sp. CA-142604 TaxID=3240024 RepID=UPI003D949C3B
MTVVGLRELREQAAELVRRVEQGEEVTITVGGRPSARLVPVEPHGWRTYAEVSDLFSGPADLGWNADRDRVDDVFRDPRSQARRT